MAMQTIKLNMIPGSVLPVVNVSQYDDKRTFYIDVYMGPDTYDLAGKTVEIRGTKPDMHGFAYGTADGVVSVSGNRVTISTTQQMTAVGGSVAAELRVTYSGQVIGSLNFIIAVEPSALSDDTIMSDTDIPVIERYLESIVDDCEEQALIAEGYAVGKQNGSAVSSGSPYYHNNASYYAGQAGTSATNASNSATAAGNSATSASNNALKSEGYAVGKQNGSAVSSGSPYYHNNADYYNTQAAGSATAAGNSATAAAADSLEAEGFAVGEQNGVPVGSGSPYYHNNAKYYASQGAPTALGSLSDVNLSTPTNGQVLKYDSATSKWVNGAGGGSGGTVYGFHIDNAESDPSTKVTYLNDAVGMTPAAMNFTTGVFSYGAWANAFFMPRPCMLKYDGTVDYYLDPTDYTKKTDGTASDVANAAYGGNAMMEWGQNGKKIWLKVAPSSDGKSADVFISDYQVDAEYHDYAFHGVNGSADHFYTPIYNGSLIDNKLRSISGQAPMHSKTVQEERDYAQANGDGYDIECFADRQLINFLLILMAKSTNSKVTYGNGNNNGYYNTPTYPHSSGNGKIDTGALDDKGLFWGSSANNAPVKVFGMENWYGNMWQILIGWQSVNGSQKVKLTYGTEDGSEGTGYDLTGAHSKNIGAALSGTSGGYISEMTFTKDGIMVPKVVSGTDSTYYTDGAWYNGTGVRVAFVGGSSGDGSHDGALCASLYDQASRKGWDFGAALSYKPTGDDNGLAHKSDLTSIIATGSTNGTGATIAAGAYFYLNGTLCRAKTSIASGATFTLNTNYEVVTACGELAVRGILRTNAFSITVAANTYTVVTASNIYSGSLPQNARYALFAIISASNNSNFNTRVYCESGNIIIWSDVAQKYGVRWFEFANVLLA